MFNTFDLPIHPTLLHPHTGEPLRAIGVTSRGPIWPIIGASEDDSSNDALDHPGESGQAPVEPVPKPKIDGDFDADRATKLIDNLRADLAKEKGKRTTVESDTQKKLDDFAKLLGLKKGADLDPEKLAADLTAAKNAERATKVELAIHRTATKHGADSEALLDSRAFLDAVKELDPTAATFSADVETAIKDAVKKNPKLKAQTVSARSGGDMPGGPGGGGTKRPTSLSAAIGKHYSGT